MENTDEKIRYSGRKKTMLLTIDIGNTNIVLGCVDDNKTYFIERLSTIKTKMELEYAIDIKTILDIHHINRADIEGAIISSVVPQITYVVKEAAEKILKKETLVIGPGVKNGLNILMDNPAQLGSDLVANAVAGIAEYKAPMMIFDLGTATTVSVIDEKLYRRHDLSGSEYFTERPDGKCIPASGNRSGSPEADCRKEYDRMYEEWCSLFQCSGNRWNY